MTLAPAPLFASPTWLSTHHRHDDARAGAVLRRSVPPAPMGGLQYAQSPHSINAPRRNRNLRSNSANLRESAAPPSSHQHPWAAYNTHKPTLHQRSAPEPKPPIQQRESARQPTIATMTLAPALFFAAPPH
ncbi:hypothetical protein HYPSUDRAFT_206036 [Hypholoma sublateritium FD-334 SS-4]|uniref:Uncharacterized protein n=1 Tax=Hypholoma sublateritium (strain FD-334 SS-4) TaxID=945553 RepID=A0A0D2NLL8_HYPSF|nr:hypothetical protein HYPSUDRAFT_206036 [Hypholoma sublateritium FD-334 SS-4]